MSAGKRNIRVTILKPVFGEPDAHNVRVPTYVPDGQVWGMVEMLSGNELLAAQQINAEITSQVTLDYLDAKKVSAPLAPPNSLGITERHKLRYIDRVGVTHVLDIVGPPLDPEGRSIEVRFGCKEAQPMPADVEAISA